jgi:hypothetical protein
MRHANKKDCPSELLLPYFMRFIVSVGFQKG